MTTSRSNMRRSQWVVFDRCLALLLRLLNAPATSRELLRIVLDQADEDGEWLSVSAAEKRFEEDRNRLRTWFKCDLAYDRGDDTYTLSGLDRPLLDLPDSALRGLAFLQATFSSDSSPMGDEVNVLIAQVLMLLPPKRQRVVEQERGILEITLQARDQDHIPTAVWDAIKSACSHRQQLEFEYRSPAQPDGEPRLHLVEPQRYYFNTLRSHYYLDAYWIESRGPYGRIPQGKMQAFRLGRIQNPRVLPTRFPPSTRVVIRHELVYELAPEIARHGVTEHFPDSQVLPQPDGGAIVHALSTNLFLDLRQLLHYGPGCLVLGGPKALDEMKRLVAALAQRYENKA